MLKQLDPQLELETPLGTAFAYFIWTSGTSVFWGCFQNETGECWWWENKYIRLKASVSEPPHKTSPILLNEDLSSLIEKHQRRYKE